MKTLCIIIFCIVLVLLQVVLFVLAISPSIIDRQSAVQAYFEWHKNPTSENETVWLREKAAMEHERTAVKVGVIVLLVINQIGITMLIGRILHLNKQKT